MKEIKMFGMTTKEMIDSKPEFTDNLMYAMQILSDAQEIMTLHGDNGYSRVFINKAKFFIDKERQELRK